MCAERSAIAAGAIIVDAACFHSIPPLESLHYAEREWTKEEAHGFRMNCLSAANRLAVGECQPDQKPYQTGKQDLDPGFPVHRAPGDASRAGSERTGNLVPKGGGKSLKRARHLLAAFAVSDKDGGGIDAVRAFLQLLSQARWNFFNRSIDPGPIPNGNEDR